MLGLCPGVVSHPAHPYGIALGFMDTSIYLYVLYLWVNCIVNTHTHWPILTDPYSLTHTHWPILTYTYIVIIIQLYIFVLGSARMWTEWAEEVGAHTTSRATARRGGTQLLDYSNIFHSFSKSTAKHCCTYWYILIFIIRIINPVKSFLSLYTAL